MKCFIKVLISKLYIEGHIGHDGRHYILDFGRSMPSETPDKRYLFFIFVLFHLIKYYFL